MGEEGGEEKEEQFVRVRGGCVNLRVKEERFSKRDRKRRMIRGCGRKPCHWGDRTFSIFSPLLAFWFGQLVEHQRAKDWGGRPELVW